MNGSGICSCFLLIFYFDFFSIQKIYVVLWDNPYDAVHKPKTSSRVQFEMCHIVTFVCHKSQQPLTSPGSNVTFSPNNFHHYLI